MAIERAIALDRPGRTSSMVAGSSSPVRGPSDLSADSIDLSRSLSSGAGAGAGGMRAWAGRLVDSFRRDDTGSNASDLPLRAAAAAADAHDSNNNNGYVDDTDGAGGGDHDDDDDDDALPAASDLRGRGGQRYFDLRTANSKTASSLLARELKGRHLQMIAIGGSIGTGLFVASGRALNDGGPAAVLLAYAVVGLMLYCTVQALGEMAVAFPVAGSFSAYSTRFLDPSWGFSMGWK